MDVTTPIRAFHGRASDLAPLNEIPFDCQIDLCRLDVPVRGTWLFELRKPVPPADGGGASFVWNPNRWPSQRVRVEIRGVEKYLIDNAEGISVYLLRDVTFDAPTRRLTLRTQLDACVAMIVRDVDVSIDVDPEVSPPEELPPAGDRRWRIGVGIALALGLVGALAICAFTPRALDAVATSTVLPGIFAIGLLFVIFVALPIAILMLRDFARTRVRRGRLSRGVGHVLSAPARLLGLVTVLFAVVGLFLVAYSVVTGAWIKGPVRFLIAVPQFFAALMFGRFGLSMLRSPLAPIGGPMWMPGDSEPVPDEADNCDE